MKVSVIIPVYNVSRYIGRCMDSVICQTWSDIECIFVDDCSSDDSVDQILKKIAAYTGPFTFRIIHHERMKGPSSSRNSGIQASTGDYLYFLDSDDEIAKNGIELLANLAKKYPGVDIVQGSSDIIEGNKTNNRYRLKKTIPEYSENHIWLKKNVLERVNIPLTAWNKLIDRRFITTNKLLFKEGIIHEDEHWTYFVAKYVRTMAFCKIPTYRHYIREGSIMTSGLKDSIPSWFIIIDDFLAHIDDDLARSQRKVILEVSFCNLIRIIKKAKEGPIDELLTRQKEMMRPFLKSAQKRKQVFEILLISYNYLPVFILKHLCKNNITGLYFHILKYFV